MCCPCPPPLTKHGTTLWTGCGFSQFSFGFIGIVIAFPKQSIAYDNDQTYAYKVYADANGVTNIPVEIGAEVAQACEELVEAEDIVLDYLKAGEVSVEGFAAARKQLGARIGELKKKYAVG